MKPTQKIFHRLMWKCKEYKAQGYLIMGATYKILTPPGQHECVVQLVLNRGSENVTIDSQRMHENLAKSVCKKMEFYIKHQQNN